jgi:hypothetical protein
MLRIIVVNKKRGEGCYMENVRSNEITAFAIEENVYRIIATDHAIKQMRVRKLDKYHIASACLGLGLKLDRYNNSGNQIMITDDGKNLSTVVVVENYTIVIITVLSKSNPYVKDNTIIEAFTYNLA